MRSQKRAARAAGALPEDPRRRFDLPLVIEGTELQKAVWRAMCAIPRGKTRTYGDIARSSAADARDVGRPAATTGCRSSFPAIASSPPTASAASRHATGGYLLEAKRWLLMHEAARTRSS